MEMKQKIKTGTPLNVLFLEDNPKDAEICRELITDSGYNLNMDITATEKGFESFLRTRKYDVILSDFNLAGFDAFGALRLYNKICPDVPFICVSGTIGEETAVGLLKLGAVDYLLKDRLEKLPFAIKKAIDDGKEKESKRKAEILLAASEMQYRRLFESAKDGILILNVETGKIVDVNPFLIELLGYSKEEFLGKEIWEIGFFKNIVANKDKFIELQQKKYIRYEDLPLETSDGRKINVEFVSNVYSVNSHKVIQCNIRDITARKQAEEVLSELIEKNPMSIQIMDKDGFTLKVNPAHSLLFGALPPPDFSIFTDLQNKGLGEYILLAKKGKVVHFPDISYNVHNVFPERPNKPLWIRAILFPLINAGIIEKFVFMHEDITERKRDEEKLHLDSQLLDNSVDSIFVVDLDGKFVYLNESAWKSRGYTHDEMMTMNLDELDTPEFKKLIEAKKKEIVEKGACLFESAHRCKDGTTIPIEVSARAVELGKRKLLITSTRDISERNRAEEKIQSLAKFPSENPFPILRVDKNGTLLYVNESGKKQLPEWNLQIEHSVPNMLKEVALNTLNNGEIQQVEFNHSEKTYSFYVAPIFGTEYVNLYGWDITERKRAEEKIKIFSSAVEDASDCFVLTNMTGDVTYANKSSIRTFGYSLAEILKLNVIQFSTNSGEVAIMNEEIRKKGIWNGEISSVKKNKEIFPAILSISLVKNDNNNPIGLMGVFRDITEQKHAETQLMEAKEKAEEMNRLKTNFLANMSHELRTPLIGILSFAQFFESELKDKELIQMAQTITTSGQRLNTTLNNILDISKIESEIKSVDLKQQDILKYLNEQVTLFKLAAESKGLSIFYKPCCEKLEVFINEEMFVSIISNLLNNAIKFTDKGSITLTVKLVEDKAMISIIDTGIGVPADKQEIIFEPFRQASEGFGRSYEGTGLGLAIVKKYMSLMGGTITVKSQPGNLPAGKAGGSTFELKFPLHKNNGK